MKVPFSPPDISELEIQMVTETLRSGWITTGPCVKELERRLAQRLGTPHCVCLSSQTACAEMVLRLLGVGPGDEVIVPAYTYTASASVVCHVGAVPVMIDSQKDSFEMDYDAVEKAINERTKVIIPVDLGGVPCDYDRIFDIVERKKALFRPNGILQSAIGRIIVCADTAHALGAEYHGRKVGSIADFSSFSFHAVKNLTTGEGGACTWRPISGIDSSEIDRQMHLLSLHGQTKDALQKGLLNEWEYDIVGTWYKCNMTDIAASLGLAQFERFEGLLERRREIIRAYDSALKPHGIEVLPHFTDRYRSSGHLYLTRIPGITSEQRNEIIGKMAQRDIALNVHYKPLPMHTAYKKLGFDIADFPNAFKLFSNEITLPLYSLLTDEQVDYVIENYLDVLDGERVLL